MFPISLQVYYHISAPARKMYQLKFLKTPTITLQNGQSSSNRQARQPKNSDPAYILSTTLTITNDLGERFFYGSTSLTIEIRHHSQNDPLKVHTGYKVLKTTEAQWDAGMMAVNVKCPLKFGELPLNGYVTVFVKVQNLENVVDELNYDDGQTPEELVKETIKHKLHYFDDVKETHFDKFDKMVFLNTVSDFMRIPAKTDAFPVKCDRMAIRFINDDKQVSKEKEVRLYEELSGTIARHLWDAGIFLNLISSETILKYTGFNATDKLDILELGTGIGLGGIRLSDIFPKAKILVTDLDDAKDICQSNIKLNNKTKNVAFGELDWESPVKTQYQQWDLILVTDCIYNPLYYDWLINVMKVEALSKTKVLFLHKFREPVSECEFFPKVRQWFDLEKQWWWRLNDGVVVHVGMYGKKN